MATCIDCGKRFNKLFTRCNLIEGKIVCGKCDDKRKGKGKVKANETVRSAFGAKLTAGNCKQ